MRRLVLPLLLWTAPLAAAPSPPAVTAIQAPLPDMGAALRAGRWFDAQAIAATERDPLAATIVQYYRLLTPAGGGSAEIAGFIADHPTWPTMAVLGRRLNEALATDHDDHGVMTVCARPNAPAILHCAEIPRPPPDPQADALRAWLTNPSDPAAEAAFMQRWGRIVTPDEQWERFERLAWTDSGAVNSPAYRQIARLDPARRPAAQARLALRRDDPSAPALVAALPADQARSPGMMLDQAKFLRRAGQDQAALALWRGVGQAVEMAAPADRRPLFWDERNLLARRLLRADDAAGAYDLANQHSQAGEARLDAEFLAGWIALRRLNRPTEAAAHFATLAEASHAAITQARAHYWLGRVADAQADPTGARTEYAAAAAWPTTYYGQLAGIALGDLPARLAAMRDPPWTVPDISKLAAHDLARAALLLAAWGEGRRGRLFLLRLEDVLPAPAFRALDARLADDLEWPDAAVGIARRAGRDGIMLPRAGWPAPFAPPATVDAAFALAIMRQESGFDREAASPVGARGLMQLMPGTATAVARRLGEPVNLPALTADGDYNMRLGTTYLAGVLAQFGGAMPLAAAAYNAGPQRVQEWLQTNGDPRTADAAAMVDWIELIPFTETRNYVQRVMENVVVYRSRDPAEQNG